MSLIPALGKLRQVDLSEFEDSLVYRVSSRTARTVTQGTRSQNTKQNKKQLLPSSFTPSPVNCALEGAVATEMTELQGHGVRVRCKFWGIHV